MNNFDKDLKLTTNSYSKTKLKRKKYDVIIVGSGVSALSCASVLSQLGKSVLVLEQHDERVGGMSSVFEEEGYEFPTGLHFLSNQKEGDIFDIAYSCVSEGKIEVEEVGNPMDTLFLGKKNQKYLGYHGKKMEVYLMEKFPREKKKIKKFWRKCNGFAKEFLPIYVLREFPSYLWFLKPIVRFIFIHILRYEFAKYLDMSIEKALDSFGIKDKNLRDILAHPFVYRGSYRNTPAFWSMYLFSYADDELSGGRCYPTEGSSMLSKKMCRVIDKYGGEIYCNARVKRFLFEKKGDVCFGVQLENGDRIYGDRVVSTANIHITYDLIKEKKYFPRNDKNFLKKNILSSVQHFTVYLGLNKPYDELGLPIGNVLFMNGIHREREFFEKTQHEDFDETVDIPLLALCHQNPIHQHRKGHSVVTLIIPYPSSNFERWESTKIKQRGNDYIDYKEKLTNLVLNKVYEVYPKLEDALDCCLSASNLSTIHWCNSYQGSSYGIEASKKRTFDVYETLVRRCIVKNLYVSGVDANFTAGIEGALLEGIFCAGRIINRNLFFELLEASKVYKKTLKHRHQKKLKDKNPVYKED